MHAVVIGIGNPLLADDAVGLKAAAALRQKIAENHRLAEQVSIKELYSRGLPLLEAMGQGKKCFLIDALVNGCGNPGNIHRFYSIEDMAGIWGKYKTSSTHLMDLETLWELGKITGMALPEKIKIWGIEVAEVNVFHENLSAEVNKAMHTVVEEIISTLLIDLGGEET